MGSLRFGVHMGEKASKMMICGVCLLQGPGPKSSQVQCAVGDSAKPASIGIGRDATFDGMRRLRATTK